MGLPKIDSPEFNLTLPVTKTKIKYRPFKVKEEKLMLIAQQTGESGAISNAIKGVIQNCVLNNVDIRTLPVFEVEWLFLQIRSTSINNIIEMNIRDVEYDAENPDADAPHLIPISINLDDVEIDQPEKKKDVISLNDDYNIKLKYPNYEDLDNIDLSKVTKENSADYAIDLLAQAIDSVFTPNGAEVFLLKDFKQDEVREFIESLSSKNFQDIQAFLQAVPAISYTIEYENYKGEKKTRELRGLIDFFTFV